MQTCGTPYASPPKKFTFGETASHTDDENHGWSVLWGLHSTTHPCLEERGSGHFPGKSWANFIEQLEVTPLRAEERHFKPKVTH